MRLTTVCQDYFQYDFAYGKWDAVVSFESLHHFLPERKKELYRKLLQSAGFVIEKVLDNPDNATIIKARKRD